MKIILVGPNLVRTFFGNNFVPPGKYMFAEYSWNIPMIYSRNIRKRLPTKFQAIFLEEWNVSGILNIRIFSGECSGNIESRNIPLMFHEHPTNVTCIFLGGSRNTILDEAAPDIG